MKQQTSKTSGSFSLFVDMCSRLEERTIDGVTGYAREDLLRRVRDLRREFASWPSAPPDSERRTNAWQTLIALDYEIASAKAA